MLSEAIPPESASATATRIALSWVTGSRAVFVVERAITPLRSRLGEFRKTLDITFQRMLACAHHLTPYGEHPVKDSIMTSTLASHPSSTQADLPDLSGKTAIVTGGNSG